MWSAMRGPPAYLHGRAPPGEVCRGRFFEPTQSLVLRHRIPVDPASCSRCIPAQSHQGDCLESGPTFSKFRARSGRGSLPSPPHPLTLEGGSHLTVQAYAGSLG